jgi:hypothetical protein
MALYQLVAGFDGVQRTTDFLCISAREDNPQWQEYLAWVAEGNEPDPLPFPSPDELYAAAMGAGIGITCAGNHTLDGTYPIDEATWGQIAGIIAMLGAGLGLPNDAPTVPWPDVNGQPHQFSAEAFKLLAKAVRDYMLGLRITWNLLQAGQEADWPANPSDIG